MKVLILCATLQEFGAYVNIFGSDAKKRFAWVFPVLDYQVDSLSITVVNTGIGKVRASVAATYFFSTFTWDLVINAGLCGALKSIEPGKFCVVDSVIQHDFDLTALGEAKYLPLDISIPTISDSQIVKLATGDSFIENPTPDFMALTNADICDMEGYAVVAAHKIARSATPLYLFKIVSDGGDNTEYECNCENLSVKLATRVIEFIKSVQSQ